MSLPSYFYRCPPELGLNAIEARFCITHYIQFENYRLLRWSSTTAIGEILYRDRECLAAVVGSIELMPPENDASDPWNDSFSSPLGLSLAAIKSLQSQTPQVVYY